MNTTTASPPDATTDGADPRAALELRQLSRSFAGRRVLGPIELRLDAGAVCLVHGPNGAGKTTLLRVVAGLLLPTTGAVWRAGPALYLRSGSGLRSAQTLGQAIGYAARLSEGDGLPVEDALDAVGLGDRGGDRVRTLSAGQRGRASLAVVLATAPVVLCLDEPGAHLDSAGIDVLCEVVHAVADRGCAVLAATHDPTGLSAVADGSLGLHDGIAEPRPVEAL